VISPDALRLTVDRAVERRRLKAVQEIAVNDTDPPLGYGSPAMHTIERALQKVAPTDATVLLQGESGSGKEIAARAIHNWRARAQDIAPLADRLLARIGAQLGRPNLTLSDGARRALAARTWPGNVRELANVLERSAILAEGREIRCEDLALLQVVRRGAQPE